MKQVTEIVAHAVAAGVVAAVTVVVTTVGYFGLLLWAVLAGEPLGGPFALIAMLITAAALIPVMLLLFLMPATAGARLLRRTARWAWWSEMPLATFALVALVGAAFLALTWFDAAELTRTGFETAGAAAGLLMLPLGLYWWSFTAADAVLRLARTAWTRVTEALRGRNGPPVNELS